MTLVFKTQFETENEEITMEYHAIKDEFDLSLFKKMRLMCDKNFFSILQEGAGVPGIRRSVPRTIKVRRGVEWGGVGWGGMKNK